jgi:hypothetical protein
MNVPNVGEKEIWDYKIATNETARNGYFTGEGILMSISKDWETEKGTRTLYGYLKKLSLN